MVGLTAAPELNKPLFWGNKLSSTLSTVTLTLLVLVTCSSVANTDPVATQHPVTTTVARLAHWSHFPSPVQAEDVDLCTHQPVLVCYVIVSNQSNCVIWKSQ